MKQNVVVEVWHKNIKHLFIFSFELSILTPIEHTHLIFKRIKELAPDIQCS